MNICSFVCSSVCPFVRLLDFVLLVKSTIFTLLFADSALILWCTMKLWAMRCDSVLYSIHGTFCDVSRKKCKQNFRYENNCFIITFCSLTFG
jgi:hypothetical protein